VAMFEPAEGLVDESDCCCRLSCGDEEEDEEDVPTFEYVPVNLLFFWNKN
jgi:hypothetical protein